MLSNLRVRISPYGSSMVNPFEIDPVIGFAIPVFLVFIGIEILIRRQQHLEGYDAPDAWASLGMGVGSAIINLGTKTLAFMAMTWLYSHRVFDIGAHWWSWLLLFFCEDLTF